MKVMDTHDALRIARNNTAVTINNVLAVFHAYEQAGSPLSIEVIEAIIESWETVEIDLLVESTEDDRPEGCHRCGREPSAD